MTYAQLQILTVRCYVLGEKFMVGKLADSIN